MCVTKRSFVRIALLSTWKRMAKLETKSKSISARIVVGNLLPITVIKAVGVRSVLWLWKWRVNGSGIRDISRVLAISTTTILKAIRLAAGKLPPLRPPNHAQTVELDEFWSFVGKKKNQRWTWLGLTSATRRIGAAVHGRRTAANCRRLLAKYQNSRVKQARFRPLAVISEVCAFGATLHRKRQNAANRKEKSELSHSLETIRAQDNCLFKERENARRGAKSVYSARQFLSA